MKNFIIRSAFVLCASLPQVAFAATLRNFSDVVNELLRIFNLIIPLFFGFALVVFLYNVSQYIGKAGEEKGREEARKYVIASIIGLFVMVAVWGLVNVLLSTINLNRATPPIPRF